MTTEEIKGSKVTNFNGTEGGTDGDQVKFRFSGSPTDLFGLSPEAGETRSMTVVAECTSGTHSKLTADGTRLEASWAIREVVVGRQATITKSKEVEGQIAIGEEDADPVAGDATDEADKAAIAEEKAAAHGIADPFAAAKLAAVPDPEPEHTPPADDELPVDDDREPPADDDESAPVDTGE